MCACCDQACGGGAGRHANAHSIAYPAAAAADFPRCERWSGVVLTDDGQRIDWLVGRNKERRE